MILVIGGAGYIGSHMVKELIKRGEDVLVMDNLERGHMQAVKSPKFIHADLREKSEIDDVISQNDIEFVMHFAAYASVGESVKDPSAYYENNVIGCYNLLEAMREANIKNFIFSSTAAVYGEPQAVPITEDHPKNPTNPYGETKWVMERMLHWEAKAYDMRSISLRYFNAAGADPDGELGEDHHPEEHLIPSALLAALGKRDELVIFGDDWDTPDGTCIRDYVHISDIVQAHILAMNALRNGAKTNAYNIGSGNGFSVKEVISATEKVVGKPVPKRMGARRAGDPARLIASSDRIRKELGWAPLYPELEQIVEHAWKWRKANPDGYQ